MSNYSFSVENINQDNTINQVNYDITTGAISGGGGNLPSGTNYGDYLFWNGSAWTNGDQNIKLGGNAGQINQGTYSIAIGYQAGYTNQPANSIIINASGAAINGATGAFYANPVRQLTDPGVESNYNYNLVYSPTYSEIACILNPNIVNRGNPGSGSSLLLDTFNTVHYYTGSGGTFSIPTLMVANGVYEVKFNCYGSSAPNDDLLFSPNFGIYAGTVNFYSVYQNIGDASAIVRATSNNSNGFFFDLVGGSSGSDPVGKITIYNNKNAKKIRIEAGDTAAVTTGSGFWLIDDFLPASLDPPPYDTVNTWNNVGNLTFSNQTFSNWNIWVSRIG